MLDDHLANVTALHFSTRLQEKSPSATLATIAAVETAERDVSTVAAFVDTVVVCALSRPEAAVDPPTARPPPSEGA